MTTDENKLITRLRNLRIKSVSVVERGANPYAHIRLAKSAAEGTEGTEGTEGGTGTETAEESFFAKMGQAISQAIAKAFRINGADDDTLEKGDAKTFDTINEVRQTFDSIYRICDALGDSLRSIVRDEELSDAEKAKLINETAEQASIAIREDVAGYFETGTGTPSPIVKENENDGGQQPPATTQPGSTGTQAPPAPAATASLQKEGETIDMKFNTEAMTPEEKAQFEDLQKRFGIAEDPVQKGAASPASEKTETTEKKPEDIYKSLHPEVMAEIEKLRKFRDDAEQRELEEVAKKYTILGKKPEDLVPVFKSLKAAGGTAYGDMLSALDVAVQAVDKSGVFGEIGKSGVQDSTADAWSKIEVAAQEIAKSDTSLTYNQAIDKACMQHPELVAAYEASRK
jgi:hypothetical protein